MKKVFSSMHEITHLWAHQRQDEARAGNVSFNGPLFFSYGTAIGRVFSLAQGRVYLVNQTRYSNSTSKHQSVMQRAIPYGCTVINVFDCPRGTRLEFTPLELFQAQLDRACYWIARSLRQRGDNVQASRSNAELCFQSANGVAETFKLRKRVSKRDRAKVESQAKRDAAESLQRDREAREHAKRRAARDALRDALRLLKRQGKPRPSFVSESDWTADAFWDICTRTPYPFSEKQQAIIKAAEGWREMCDMWQRCEWFRSRVAALPVSFGVSYDLPATMPDTREGVMQWANLRHELAPIVARYETERAEEIRAEQQARALADLVAWRNGGLWRSPFATLPVAVRLVCDEKGRLIVETSHRASVLLAQALRLFKLCQKWRSTPNAQPWVASSESGVQVGPYHLRRIDAEGNATVGCHHLPFVEMKRLFDTLTPEQIAEASNVASEAEAIA